LRLKITFNAPMVLGFVVLCLGAMVLNTITNGKTNPLLFMTYRSSLKEPLTYLRFFTHVLGHTGCQHFIGNISYILLLGPLLEEKYGGARILRIILITALVTGIINYVFFWNTALCGASGICFAFILLASFTSFKDGEIPITFILVTVIFLGQQIYESLYVQDDISNMAHVIGGVIGAGFGFTVGKKRNTRKK